MAIRFEMEDAIEKAENFLQKHHDTINLKTADLEDNIWYLIFDVGFLSEQLKEIKLDAESGKILGYTNLIDDDDDDNDDDEEEDDD